MTLPSSRFAAACATVLVLLLGSATRAATYRDALRHFTLGIPPGWREMDPAEVESFNRAHGPSPWTPKLMYTAGFRQEKQPPGTGPITLILAYDPATLTAGNRGCGSDHMMQSLATGADGSLNEPEGTLEELVQGLPLRDMFRDGLLGGGVVDWDHRWVINRYRVQTAPWQVMEQLHVVHLGADGFVTVQSHFRTEEAEALLPVFVQLNDSFRFDEGYGPQDAGTAGTANPPGFGLPISGATLAMAVVDGAAVVLCGSLIGIVICLVVAAFRKKERRQPRPTPDTL